MKLVPLASGSAGNAFVVQTDSGGLLVDAGISAKQLEMRMDQAGLDPEALSAIILSHGHSDHTKGVSVFSRRYKLPVWMNRGTWQVVQNTLGKVHALEFFETGRIFQIADIRLHPFSVPHDCADPVGFRITAGVCRAGIATDLGTPTGLVANLLAGVHVLVLESNHDPVMLRDGPYPWELKQRVRGRLGHLSNQESAGLLERVVSDELQTVILAHVSATNNKTELALECARRSLGSLFCKRGVLFCASQDQVGPVVEW